VRGEEQHSHRVIAIGVRARAALQHSRGRAEALAAFPGSPYLRAAGDLIWVGTRVSTAHPRAVLLDAPVTPGSGMRFGALPAAERAVCAAPAADPASLARAREGCAALISDLRAIGEPRGLGMLLAGGMPAFPLDACVPLVERLATALRANDAGAAYGAAFPLLGLGTGLTPSGDDLVGAMLFAKLLAARVEGDLDAWLTVAQRLAVDVETRSNEISAALFADLAAGESFASLAALARALCAGNHDAAIASAGALAPIGHSSGWDMLAGFVLGLTGTLGERK
jgi:Protein of unknown function (DUF2877)